MTTNTASPLLVATTLSVWGLPAAAGIAAHVGIVSGPVAVAAALTGTMSLAFALALAETTPMTETA